MSSNDRGCEVNSDVRVSRGGELCRFISSALDLHDGASSIVYNA